MIEIRFAAPADVPTIFRLIRELADFERASDSVVATEAMLHQAFFGPKPAAEAFVALHDGETVGMAVFFHNFSTWTGRRGLYLEDLYVTDSARGFGVGGALLRRLAALAIERNCARFEWSVLDWNERAIKFYRACGAEPLNEWTVQRVSGEALERLADGACDGMSR